MKSPIGLESLTADFRFGLRMMRKHRNASLAAIASLGFAIGACTTAFVLIDALIFRPLPVRAPGQLVELARVMPGFFNADNQPRESRSFSYGQYGVLREAARGQADLFALATGMQLALADDSGDGSESIPAEAISGGGMRILGVRAALGRLIEPDDDKPGSQSVVVLSNAFWKRRFGGSKAVLGSWLAIGREREPFQIIGVAAAPFFGVQPGYLTDVWIPLTTGQDPRRLADPDNGNLQVWGRVAPETNRAELQDRLQAAVTNFLRERVRINPPRNLRGAQLEQFTDAPLRMRDASSGADSLFRVEFRRPLYILCLICGLLLLIACSNVANLMLARAAARDAEMALRLSLGAGRGRLIRQMLVESAQVAAAATVLALGFAALAAPAIVARLGPTEFPAWLEVAPDAAALAFAAALSLVTVLLFGLAPAIRATSASPNDALRAGGAQITGRVGALGWMLSAEIGFSVSLLFLSGLLLLSFQKLVAVDLGFNPGNVVLFDLVPRQPGHQGSSGADLLDSLRHLPEVEAASISEQRPMGGDMGWVEMPFVRFPGRASEAVRPRAIAVSPGFFQALEIRWSAGRDFLPGEQDGKSASVVVNQAFVNQFLRGQDPIGQQFDRYGDDPDPVRQQIIGVVANSRFNNLREPEAPSLYTPLRDVSLATLNIRTRSRAAAAIPGLRRQIGAAASGVSVRRTILLQEQIDNTMIRERLLAILGAFFSAVALLLAGVGLYGVINYAALRRTREIGIRIALGARRGSVVGLIVSHTARYAAIGIVLGIPGGMALARYLAAQLFGVKSTDLWSLVMPVACLLVVAAASLLPPAIRAASADPLIALKYE